MMAVTHGIVGGGALPNYAATVTVITGLQFSIEVIGPIGATVTLTVNGVKQITTTTMSPESVPTVGNTGTVIGVEIFGAPTRVTYTETTTKITTRIEVSKMSTITSMESFANGCGELVFVSLPDTANVTSFGSAFFNCIKLPAFPDMDTAAGTSLTQIALNCEALICIPRLNTLNNLQNSNMFTNTPLLTNPNAAEQTAIEGGSNYVNAGACG